MKKNKKHIKLITYGNFPYGGASANLLRNFSLGLSEKGNDIEVLLPKGIYYGNNVEKNHQKKAKIDSVVYRHFCYTNHPKNYVGKLIDNVIGPINLYFYILKQKRKNKADVIIKYNTTLSSDLFFLFTGKIFKIKTICIIPEFYEKPKKNIFSLKLIKWYDFYLGIRFLSKHVDGLIVLSTFLENFLINKVRYKKSIIIQPNFIDSKNFEMPSKILPFKEDQRTIGYVGTPTKKDGVIDLLNSFQILLKKYPNTHLLIIGDITNGKTIIPKLKKYALKLNVINNITFTGLVPSAKIPFLLHSCDILALTRPKGIFAEAGFPTKLGEYFACKKPVVITKVGDIPKYFNNNEQAILVNPEDPVNISKGFEYLLKNKNQATKIGENGFCWMKKNLDYHIVSDKINKFINNI